MTDNRHFNLATIAISFILIPSCSCSSRIIWSFIGKKIVLLELQWPVGIYLTKARRHLCNMALHEVQMEAVERKVLHLHAIYCVTQPHLEVGEFLVLTLPLLIMPTERKSSASDLENVLQKTRRLFRPPPRRRNSEHSWEVEILLAGGFDSSRRTWVHTQGRKEVYARAMTTQFWTSACRTSL